MPLGRQVVEGVQEREVPPAVEDADGVPQCCLVAGTFLVPDAGGQSTDR